MTEQGTFGVYQTFSVMVTPSCVQSGKLLAHFRGAIRDIVTRLCLLVKSRPTLLRLLDL